MHVLAAPRSRTRSRVVGAVALAAIFGVGVGVGALITHDAPNTTVTRTEFTNRAGQDCTQVITANAVAITCAYKPAETRIGRALEGLGQ